VVVPVMLLSQSQVVLTSLGLHAGLLGLTITTRCEEQTINRGSEASA
jgi:hypothetical protein